jgi:hypothetical protein
MIASDHDLRYWTYCGLLLQSEMHPLVPAVLLRMTGPNPFDGDAEPQPPYRKFRKLKKPVRRRERNAVVGADGAGQAALSEKALEGPESQLFAIRLQRFAQQQITRSINR